MIDNDSSVRAALSTVLQSANFDILAFASIFEFIKKARLNNDACILVDIETPSVEVLSLHLASRHLKIPVIAVSVIDHPSVRQKAQELGAVSFFIKPIDEQTLIDAITVAIQKVREERSERR